MTAINRIEIPIPFPIRSVNCYFIEDSTPTLIDAGFCSAEGLDVLELAIKKAGYRLSDIKRILLTHGHMDHVGLAGKIVAISGAEVLIHPLDQDKCIWDVRENQVKRMAPFLRFFKEAGLPDAVIRDISDRMSDRFERFFPGDFDVKYITGHETFSFDDFTLKVICCPGHTPGAVCFFDRNNGRLFSGDHLLKNITSNPVVEVEYQDKNNGYRSLSSYLKSLEMIAAMEVKEVLPGHGAPFSNSRERVDEIIHAYPVSTGQRFGARCPCMSNLPPEYSGASVIFLVKQPTQAILSVSGDLAAIRSSDPWTGHRISNTPRNLTNLC